MKKNEILKRINKVIKNSNKILVVGHDSPDGDTAGAQSAIAEYLYILKKDFKIICGENFPEYLLFLPHLKESINLREKNLNLSDYDLCIVLDCGDEMRFETIKDKIPSQIFKINIDHHRTNDKFGDINFVNSNYSSCCEMLYDFFQINKITMNKNISISLYTGILTDTGSFQYRNVKYSLFKKAYHLVRKGASPFEISMNVFRNKDEKYISLLGVVLSRIEKEMNGRILHSYITYDDYTKYGYETEGIINYLGLSRSCEVYFLIKEKERGVLSLSIRSKNEKIDVSKLVSVFKGGGHKAAAGCKVKNMDLKEFQLKLIEIIKKEM